MVPETTISSRVELLKQVDGRPYFQYEAECVLKNKFGEIVGDGYGSANTREPQYAYRWVFDNDIPEGVDKATLPTKEVTSKKQEGRKYTMYRVSTR